MLAPGPVLGAGTMLVRVLVLAVLVELCAATGLIEGMTYHDG